MGHERVGSLPKSKRWIALVNQMGALYRSGEPISGIAVQTLNNVRTRYEALSKDEAVKAVFTFMVAFARACSSSKPSEQLQDCGIRVNENSTLLSVLKSLKDALPTHETTSEYGQLAVAAAADAMGQWHRQHTTQQLALFQPSSESFESWRALGNGAGFCELSRLYFGKLTERYLNYFLDRAASASFPSLEQRERFHHDMEAHVDDVSKHAFETAKITQSFAAGWFNKNVHQRPPGPHDIEGFLSLAFGKLRDELRREAEER
jgi:hypothetical protein